MTQYGYFLSCEENTPQDLVEQAKLAEQAGYADQVLPRLRGA